MNNHVYQTLILGGGFTGLFTALHLSHQHYPRSVILIDKEERFCFKPLLYEYFSGEMDAQQVRPRFEELLKGSGVIFVQDAVSSIDLVNKQIQLASGTCYEYSNLVLSLGSVTGYFGVEGAQEYALPFRTGEDAIAVDRQLRERLQQATQTEDPKERRKLLTVAVIGGGPAGVEMAGTLADLLPNWYEAMGGKAQEIRVVLLHQGREILEGDVNRRLRDTAGKALQQRTVAVELFLGAQVTAIRPDILEYKRHEQSEILEASTVVWTTGTNTNPVIKMLPIPDEHRDQRGRLKVTFTLQLPNFPEVFAGGDCTVDMSTSTAQGHQYQQPELPEKQHVNSQPLPPTAQVAYQQGATIARNLKAMTLGDDLIPNQVNLRGTLLKLGLEESAANLGDRFQITGEIGHLIRQSTYLQLLPTPIHNLKATTKWLTDEVFVRYSQSVKTADAIKWVGGAVITAIVARKLLKMLTDDDRVTNNS